MHEWWLRFSQNMLSRLDGPLHLRFILQPAMSILLALRDGVRDAHANEPAYLWSLFTDSGGRMARIKKGWKSISRVFLLALGIDAIYQLIAFHFFYLGEALLTATLLALMPYGLLRGPISRIVRLLSPHRRAPEPLRSARS